MQQWKYAFFEITGWLYSSGSTACVGFGGCLVCTQQWSTAVLLYPRHYSDNSCGRLCGKYKKNGGPHIMSLFCDTQLYLFLHCCSYLNSIVTLHLTGIFCWQSYSSWQWVPESSSEKKPPRMMQQEFLHAHCQITAQGHWNGYLLITIWI